MKYCFRCNKPMQAGLAALADHHPWCSEPMRALTLRQPWAWAICHAGKRVENRHRPIPVAQLGTRIALHAGAGTDRDGWDRLPQLTHAWPESFPVAQRAIVGTAMLAGNDGDADSPWANPCAVHWELDDVVVFDQPVPCQRGQLGLWKLDIDTEKAVLEAERRSRR